MRESAVAKVVKGRGVSILRLDSLSLETREAWGIKEPYVMRFDEAAALFFKLRAMPDTPQSFPKGKWASIQALEGVIDRRAQLVVEQALG
jgi:hypothetical protein